MTETEDIKLRPIPQEWIMHHVDVLLKLAKSFDKHSPMQDCVLIRAEHAMDLVKAFRESQVDMQSTVTIMRPGE